MYEAQSYSCAMFVLSVSDDNIRQDQFWQLVTSGWAADLQTKAKSLIHNRTMLLGRKLSESNHIYLGLLFFLLGGFLLLTWWLIKDMLRKQDQAPQQIFLTTGGWTLCHMAAIHLDSQNTVLHQFISHSFKKTNFAICTRKRYLLSVSSYKWDLISPAVVWFRIRLH